MRAPFDQIVYGYHGCDRSVGEAVLLGKTSLKNSTNDYDWLGSGIYFWENAPAKAFEWAKLCKENPRRTKGKISQPYVIGAIIQLQNCWNLLDKEHHSLLIEAHKKVSAVFENAGKSIPQNTEKNRALDCAVINAAHELWQMETGSREPFDSVRAAFIEGEPLYQTAGFYSDTHIQICVRNAGCIKGFFRPEL